MARELLQCKLLEGGHDVLLERVAELLGFAASGAHPFSTQLPSQAQATRAGAPHAPAGSKATPTSAKLSAPDRRRRCPRPRPAKAKDSA